METSRNTNYLRTINGLISQIYRGQIRNSKTRGHKEPEYTREWFDNWFKTQPILNKIYEEWKKSGYEKSLTPSVDRINANRFYTKDNIQLMTWGSNKRKGELDKKEGIVKGDSKPIVQYDKNLNKIKEYHSISEADRQTGIDFRNISAVLNGKRKTTGGFIWRFKDE